MTDVNEIAVLASALLALALGSIWYSPLIFGRHWQKEAGLSDADLIISKTALVRSLVVALVSNGLVLFVIAHLVRLRDMYSFSSLELGIGIAVLLVASVANMVVWEKRSLMYFLIHLGYALLIVCMGILMFSYWPW
jgi:hypothetical protein